MDEAKCEIRRGAVKVSISAGNFTLEGFYGVDLVR